MRPLLGDEPPFLPANSPLETHSSLFHIYFSDKAASGPTAALRRLFRDGLARNSLVGIGVCDLYWLGLGAGHDFKARVEVDHSRRELL